MAKKSTKTNSRAVVNGAKKKTSLSLTKRTMLLGLVGLLVLSTIAGYGWHKWQDHQIKAKAETFGTVVLYSVSSFYGTIVGQSCKVSAGNSTYIVRSYVYVAKAGQVPMYGESLSAGSRYVYGSMGTTISTTVSASTPMRLFGLRSYAGSEGTSSNLFYVQNIRLC